MDWRVIILLVLFLLSSCEEQSIESLNEFEDDSENHSQPTGPLCARGALPKGIVRNQDFLDFPNFGYRGIGRCRGHSLVSQRLLYFMRFRPHLPRDWDCELDQLDCQAKLREKLSSVNQNKVVAINGYANLRELSSELPLRSIFRSEVLKIPHRYSASPIQISESPSRQIALFRDLQRRVRLNHLTYVSLIGVAVGQHGVLAYAAKKKNGREILCVRDSNIIPESGEERCLNFFYLEAESILYERDARGVSQVSAEIFSDEEVRLNSFRQSLCLARKQGYL